MVFPELSSGIFAANSLEDFLSAGVLGLESGEDMLGKCMLLESLEVKWQVERQGEVRTL